MLSQRCLPRAHRCLGILPTFTNRCKSTMSATVSTQAAGLLEADEDRYDGVLIKTDSLPSDPATFKAALQQSLKTWAAQGKKGVWLKIPRDQSQLISIAVEPGFVFHHAEPDYVMMTKWLPEHLSDSLPPNASHQVGVGAIVVNSRCEMLVVQEANGPLRGEGFWKMPTGLVHAGEDLIDAVEREVFEETGIKAHFKSIIAIRQAHGFSFGKSDLFFCCGLVLDDDQPISPRHLRPCEREIAAVQWMPMDEYQQQPFFSKLPSAYHTMLERCEAWAEGRYKGMNAKVFEGSALRPRRDLLMWGDDDVSDGPVGIGGSSNRGEGIGVNVVDKEPAAAAAAPVN